MRTPGGKKFSPRRQALRALRIAETKADKKSDPREASLTRQRGARTAIMWLDGTHPKLQA